MVGRGYLCSKEHNTRLYSVLLKLVNNILFYLELPERFLESLQGLNQFAIRCTRLQILYRSVRWGDGCGRLRNLRFRRSFFIGYIL